MYQVSVIVPVYNLEKKGLDKCLNSLVNQTFKNIEIIIVNDGSTDGSQQIIDKYKKTHKNISLYTIKNSGQAVARNLGLSKAKGEYISFIDGDDYIDLNTYEQLNKYMCLHKDLILFDYKIIDSTNIEYIKAYNPLNKLNVTNREYLISNVVSPCNKLIKKSYLDSLNFKFPERIIYEDYASIPTLVLNNPSIVYVDKAFYNYVHFGNSTTRNKTYQKKYEDLFLATDYLYKKLRNSSFLTELEYIICYHHLYLGSYNFYTFKKFDKINVIADYIKQKFPRWKKNIYIKKLPFKTKFLMNIYYTKRYSILFKFQKISHIFRKGNKK